MPPIDLSKTARNRRIAQMKAELRALLPAVLAQTDFDSEASLNATIGGWAKSFIDLHHDVVHSSEQYAQRYMAGLQAGMIAGGTKCQDLSP